MADTSPVYVTVEEMVEGLLHPLADDVVSMCEAETDEEGERLLDQINEAKEAILSHVRDLERQLKKKEKDFDQQLRYVQAEADGEIRSLEETLDEERKRVFHPDLVVWAGESLDIPHRNSAPLDALPDISGIPRTPERYPVGWLENEDGPYAWVLEDGSIY